MLSITRIFYGALAVALLSLTACEPLETPTPALPTAAAPAGRESPAPAALSGLFDIPWEDRTPFAAGLVSGQQDALASLPGASIYHIDLTIDAGLASLAGRQALRYTNREEIALSEVVLRLFPNLTGGSMAVTNLAVDGWPVQPLYEQKQSVLRVPLAQPLKPGQAVTIRMEFTVAVPTQPDESNYGAFAYLDGVLALAHAYPMAAVYDDEGWNTEIAPAWGDIIYADSSFYLARVDAPADLVIVASGVAIDEERAGGRQTVTFAAGPARDFYLVASPDYRLASRQVGETIINSYSLPSGEEGSALVLQAAAGALRAFEERFGPYPYTEMDLAATATGALGIEYPGVMAIAGRIYDGAGQAFLESTTIHEVAHQWFYNVVGNDQVDEPWLDEALAQYATLLYFRDRYGQAGYDGFRQSLTGRWQRVSNAEIPIGRPVEAYSSGNYGAIIYGRGPLFFEALEETMGKANFALFLQDYYRSHRWGIATTESFRALAEESCACDLTALFEKWLE